LSDVDANRRTSELAGSAPNERSTRYARPTQNPQSIVQRHFARRRRELLSVAGRKPSVVSEKAAAGPKLSEFPIADSQNLGQSLHDTFSELGDGCLRERSFRPVEGIIVRQPKVYVNRF
jgi:hypothetical protein